MSINIDHLNEAELLDLNRRIVERVRFLRQARAHVAMLKFRIGERVWFEPHGQEPVRGVVTRYNKKSVSVLSDDGTRWTVAPSLLWSEEQNEPEADTVEPFKLGVVRPSSPR